MLIWHGDEPLVYLVFIEVNFFEIGSILNEVIVPLSISLIEYKDFLDGCIVKNEGFIPALKSFINFVEFVFLLNSNNVIPFFLGSTVVNEVDSV